MRLQTLATAAAISLLLVPPSATFATPIGFAFAGGGGGGNNTTAPPALAILSPSDGERLEPGQDVTLAYDHPAGPPGRVAGEVRLDGQRVGTFVVSSDQTRTFVSVTVDLAGIAEGPHALDASAWTDADAAVDAGPVTVDVEAYDAPPSLRVANVSATLDPTTVHVRGVAADNDSASLTLTFSVGNASVEVSAEPGPFDLSLVTPLRPGSASFTVRADDGVKSATFSGFVWIPGHAPQVAITSVRHEIGGHLVVEGTASDPDGYVRSLLVGVGAHTVSPKVVNGTFEASLYGALAVGNVTIFATAQDDLDGKATATTTFDVEPIHATVYDRVVTSNLGVSLDGEPVTLPQAVNATVTIASAGPAEATVVVASNGTYAEWGGAAGVPPAQKFATWGYHATATVQWLVAAGGRLEITISGDFL